MLRIQRLIPVLLAGLLFACRDSPVAPPRTPSVLRLSETALVLDDGATAQLAASLLDQHGQPFGTPPAGYALSWSSADPGIATVSTTGLVQAHRAGQTEIRATAGVLQATASLTVRGVAATLQLVAGGDQQGTVGSALTDTVVARVVDRHGDGVPGVQVRFVAAQGGSFAPDSLATDAEGVARALWRLGTVAGEHSATVSAAALTPLSLSARADPGPAAYLEVSPAAARVIWKRRLTYTATAFDAYDNETALPEIQWRANDPRVVTVFPDGTVQTRVPGLVEIQAIGEHARGSTTLEIFTFEHDTVAPYLATPAAGYLWEVPVLIISYLPTADGEMLDVAHAPDYWSLNPVSLERMHETIDLYNHRVKFSLEEGSRFRGYKAAVAPPSLGYRVVASITAYEQVPAGLPIAIGPHTAYLPDFPNIFARFDVKRYVEELGVKEIWFWAGGFDATFPSYDPAIHKPENARVNWESNMASPVTGDISNSDRNPNDLPIYNSTYVVYGSHIRRTQAEAVHNHGHQIEVQFSHANWRQDGNTDLFWKHFVGQDAAGNFVTGRAGWTHMPPNTTTHYDWYNPTFVASDIEDWRPDNLGEKNLVHVATWSGKDYNWPLGQVMPQKGESQWYIYWMQNMPGRDNEIPHGEHRMTNWWEFIGDWDGAMQQRLGLHTGPAAPGERRAFTFERPLEPPRPKR